MTSEQSPQDPLSQFVLVQVQDQTSSRSLVRLSLIATMGQRRARENLLFRWREDSGASRAEVVVLNHPPASVRESNESRPIGEMLSRITSPFEPFA